MRRSSKNINSPHLHHTSHFKFPVPVIGIIPPRLLGMYKLLPPSSFESPLVYDLWIQSSSWDRLGSKWRLYPWDYIDVAG